MVDGKTLIGNRDQFATSDSFVAPATRRQYYSGYGVNVLVCPRDPTVSCLRGGLQEDNRVALALQVAAPAALALFFYRAYSVLARIV